MADKDWYTCPKHWVAWLKSDGENCPVCQLQAENKRLKEILRIGCYCNRTELISWLRENKVKSDQPFFKDNTVILRMIVIQQALKETEDTGKVVL